MVTEVTHAPYQDFLAAFGEAAAVSAEINTYWQGGGSPEPVAVYNHLVDARVNSKAISQARGELLKRYFAESFAPEPVTTFAPKHREPLIKALMEAYAKAKPNQRIFRVEADIINLGGLNAALNPEPESGKTPPPRRDSDKKIANAVIRVMAGIWREEIAKLGKDGNATAIRHGGDELCMYVLPQEDVSKEQIDEANVRAQERIAEFIQQAGLRNVVHTKQEKPPGVGAGFAVTDIHDEEHRLRSAVAISCALDKAIHSSKDAFQAMFGKPDANAAPVPLEQVERALADARWKNYAEQASSTTLEADTDFTGDTPDAAEEARLARAVKKASESADLSDAEQQLTTATANLCRKIDFVTGLPEFGVMASQLMPNFKANHGNNAMLVHVDFNNLGGGNKLGPWVGDAVAKLFADCVTEAMKTNGHQAFLPYLASQGGGKFALLLPKLEGAQANAEQVTRVWAEIENNLLTRSKQPLPLTDEEFAATKDIVRAEETTQKAKRNGGAEKSASRKLLDDNATSIALADISNLKSRRHGSRIVCTKALVDLDAPKLKETMDAQEANAAHGQGVIAQIEQRHYDVGRRLKEMDHNVGDKESSAAAKIFKNRGEKWRFSSHAKKLEMDRDVSADGRQR